MAKTNNPFSVSMDPYMVAQMQKAAALDQKAGGDVQQLRSQLLAAREVIQQQVEQLERFGAPPLNYASVLQVSDETLTVVSGGGFVEVVRPKDIELGVGDTVLVATDSMQIVQKASPVTTGMVSVVSRVLGESEAEISSDGTGSPKIVIRGKGVAELRDGDKVVLDPSGNVIVRAMRVERERYDFTGDTGVTWASIGGQEEAKRQMIEAVELPIQQSAIFRHYGKRPTKGILLYGPSGCGKTMLGKAAATAIAKASNSSSSAAFMYIKGPELLDPYVGSTEAAIRALFKRARMHKAEHGSPAVVFIDEADAILGRRGGRNSFMEKTVVPAFLTEMDGMEESGALVILATNRPDTLDSAITRDGRIDRKVRVSRPTREEAESIFGLYLGRVPLASDHTVETVARAARDALFDSTRAFYHVTTEGGTSTRFTLANLVSGALIAGVVDQAVSIAMHRDLAASGKPSGVREQDVLLAVEHVYRQNRDVDHRDALLELTDGREIVNLQRIGHAAETAEAA